MRLMATTSRAPHPPSSVGVEQSSILGWLARSRSWLDSQFDGTVPDSWPMRRPGRPAAGATTASARPTRIAPAHGRFGPTEEAAPGSATSARAEEAGRGGGGRRGPVGGVGGGRGEPVGGAGGRGGRGGWKGCWGRRARGRGGAVRGRTTTCRASPVACARELWRADWAARVSIIGVVADTKRPAPARRTGRGQATVPKDDVSELGYGTVTLKTGAVRAGASTPTRNVGPADWARVMSKPASCGIAR